MLGCVKFRRSLSLVLIFITLFSSILSFNSFISYADSNNLRQTYLQLMSGASAANVTDITNLTVNDLRPIALFLSNFYVPYNTSLDDEENKESTVTMMTNVLKNLGFNQDAAEVLVNSTFAASLSSVGQLYVSKSDLSDAFAGGDQIVDICDKSFWEKFFTGIAVNTTSKNVSSKFLFGTGDDNADPGVSLVYSNTNDTYRGALGKAEIIGNDSYYPLSVFIYTAMAHKTLDGVVPRIRFFFKSSSNTMVPCFEFNKDTANIINMFAKTVDGTDHSIGNAIFNCSYSEYLDMSDSEKWASTSFTQKMYVDWVGNLIADFGDTRVIMYPGCINPYTFGKITSNTDLSPVINLVSTWGIYFANTDWVNFEDNSYVVTPTNYNVGFGAVRNSASGVDGETWDTCVGSGKGEGDEVRKTLINLGVFTGKDDQLDTTFSFKGYPSVFGANNTLSTYLQYKSVTNDTIESLSNGSAFLSVDFLQLDNGCEGFFTDSSKFSKKANDFSSFMQFTNSSDMSLLSCFFLTYAFAYHNRSLTSFDEANPGDAYINMKFNFNNFPSSIDTSIVWDSINSDSERITSFIYYLLHPTEGVRYVATLFKNKVSGILVGWHEDMVGATDSNSTTGMTQYLGFTGYVTSPSLKEISWVVELIDKYDSVIVYLIILMCVILLCYVLTGYMTLHRGFIGIIFFSILAFLPPIAINAVTDTINNICDTIYTDKFDYWSYTQLQTYLSKLGTVTSASSVNDYIQALMDLDTSSTEYYNGFAGVKVKWMSPKKIRDSRASNEIGNVLQDDFSSTMISALSGSLSNTNRVEEYVDGVAATYLYRDFSDVFKYGVESYNLFTTYDFAGGLDDKISAAVVAPNISSVSSGLAQWNRRDELKNMVYYSAKRTEDNNYNEAYLKDYILANVEVDTGGSNLDYIVDTSSLNAIRRGFLNDTINLRQFDEESDSGKNRANYYFKSGALAPTFLLNYFDTVHSLNSNYGRLVKDLSSSSFRINVSQMSIPNYYYGLAPSAFDYSLYAFETDGRKSEESGGGKDVAPDFDQLSAFYYALYAESPYYYFNYNFRDYVTASGSNYSYIHDAMDSSSGNIHSLFVKDNQAYFYNFDDDAGDGYGELRDFMNFHDLFYYVMPCLNTGNKIADTFDQAFGMYVNDDLQLQITPEGKVKYSGVTYDSIKDMGETRDSDGKNVFEQMNDEELYKFWHDYNVWTIFQGYVPWLDTMQDCKYAKPEVIEVIGEKFLVENPLDPTSYFRAEGREITQGRYMVFSRSEMNYYGLDITDLTTVERKIISIQDNVYKQAVDLMNYYTLADEVLINAFAMIQTFEFNKEFSQSSLFGSSYTMYPQGYEAKAFSYDAYLRLVIAEASGEPIQVAGTSGETSIYRRVISKTSLFFGLFLLVNDVLSVYIIPCLKVAFLIMLFFISVLLIIAASIKLELNIVSVCWKSIFQPLSSYFLVSVGFAWLVSLFMSNGATGVTDTSLTISVGDPTTVIIIMIVINVAVMILYFKIAKACFKDLKVYLQSVVDSIASTVVGALQRMGAVVANGKRNRAYRSLNKMANGIPTTASQRGSQNTGVGAGVAGGIAGVLAAKAMGAGADDSGNGEGNGGSGGYSKPASTYDSKASLAKQSKAARSDLAASEASDRERREAKDYNSLENRGKRGMESANEKLDTAKDYAAAFKNGGVGLGERAKLGVGAAKYGVAGAAQKAKGAIQTKTAQGVKGIGRKIDGATGGRLGKLVNGNGDSAETAMRRARATRIEDRRKSEMSKRHAAAEARDAERLEKDRQTQKQYHESRKGQAGGKAKSKMNEQLQRTIIRNAERENMHNVLRNRAGKSGILIQ